MRSHSAVTGYMGSLIDKNVLIAKSALSKQTRNLPYFKDTFSNVGKFGKGLGAVGMILTIKEDWASGNLNYGTAAKVALGIGLMGVSAPLALTYTATDIGVYMYSGTSLTDRIGNGVNNMFSK